jgi:hypothetical protein
MFAKIGTRRENSGVTTHGCQKQEHININVVFADLLPQKSLTSTKYKAWSRQECQLRPNSCSPLGSLLCSINILSPQNKSIVIDIIDKNGSRG